MLIFSLLLVSAPEAAMSSNLPVNEKIREHYPENKFSSDTEIKTDEYGLKTEFLFSLGYRSDDFDWNIAGNTILGNYVNVLSELTWRNIEIYQVKLRNRTNTMSDNNCDNYHDYHFYYLNSNYFDKSSEPIAI